ncbi:MAG: hypothetical protein HEQ35_31630 [Gloeotrichia echinulata IR180]
MTLDRVYQLRGFPQPDGWWSGCGLTPNTAQLGKGATRFGEVG